VDLYRIRGAPNAGPMPPGLVIALYLCIVLDLGVLLRWEFRRARERRIRPLPDDFWWNRK
jgi:hypothetical protein